jgi:hypothetical protein
MKVNGLMIKLMEKVGIYIEMEHLMKVIGMKINNMVTVLKDGLMELSMKVSITWV